jgi:hypothetical protein
MGITGFAVSMAVNALMTGLIVFQILKVFLEVNRIVVELTLDSTGGTKLRHAIFVIIESGMALFAIQLIRIVFSVIQVSSHLPVYGIILEYVIVIHEMLNVTIKSVHFCFSCLLITFTRASHQQ